MEGSKLRIARNLKTDKRTKSNIEAKVLKTKVLLNYNNLQLNLKQVDALRISNVLSKAVAIQETKKNDDTNTKLLKSLMIRSPI